VDLGEHTGSPLQENRIAIDFKVKKKGRIIMKVQSAKGGQGFKGLRVQGLKG